MKTGVPYKHWTPSGSYDAIVIGSGMGGLASAALLAKHAGKRVLVLERHYVPGGFTHTFRRPGYEWDVGLHYIGDVLGRSTLRRAFDHVTDGGLRWADMGEVYDTAIFEEERYPFRAGAERLRADLEGWFPRERRAIGRYFDLVRRSVRRSTLFFAEKALPGPISTVLGPLLRAGALRSMRRTTLETLRSLTSDERLIGVLTAQWGDYGLPPARSSFFVHALIAAHYFKGAAYPVGGSSRIAETVGPVIERAGGALVVSAEVSSIVTRGGRAVGVRLADGQELHAPLIISDAGVSTTFGRLLPAEEAPRCGWQEMRACLEPSGAHACLYLGFRKSARELGLPSGNFWLYPGYDHDANCARFAADPAAPFPVVFVSFPSAKDPEFEDRHPGHATGEMIVMMPFEGVERWSETRWKKRGADYDAWKESFSSRLLESLRRLFPKAADAVEHAELSTPLTTRHFTGHPRGEIYGLSHTPARFECRRLRPETRVPGLYLTGADVCTAGVSGALMGGVLTASAVLRRNLLGAIGREPVATAADVDRHAPARAA
jgi:all-trans-retinol 13,14-reductase